MPNDISEKLEAEFASLLEPLNEHNQNLIRNVHPPDWVNPEPAERYHLVVIGGGTAGLVSAAGAAGLGARVALVERRFLGGDCLNHGCVPSKSLIRSARAWHDARTGAEKFGAPEISGPGDFAAAMDRMRRLRAGISHHDSAQRFSDLGVDVFIGDGKFVASDALEVGGKRLRFRKAIVATGARPTAPPIPGLAESGYLDNETVFNFTELPERLAVIGAGPIGCELSQVFARFGTEVFLIEAMHGILPIEDPDASKIVETSILRDGVKLLCCGKKTVVERLPDGRKRITLESHDTPWDLEVDEILVAAGRAPNVEGIGLEAAGVQFDRFGVQVNDRLQTSNRQIYAVGDVASKYKFTHAADALARIAIQNSLFFGRAKASDLVIPWCTYTNPEIAHVGLYEKDAKETGVQLDTLDIPMKDVDRAVLDGAQEGFLRLHVKRGSDTILGATLVADHAGELLAELTLAMTHRIGLGKIASTIHPYPTQSEAIKKAADSWRRGKLTPAVKKLFELFFKIFS
jgi:pyruvate/2-oxoglutarate dehydrogenase complex dihydrolipoamide dehydrogenase (E3) component